MMRDELRALIEQLRLHGMADALDVELARAEREAIAAPDLLCSARRPRRAVNAASPIASRKRVCRGGGRSTASPSTASRL
jgi:hypothetical protein